MRRYVEASNSFSLSLKEQENRDKFVLLQEGIALLLLVGGMVDVLFNLSGGRSFGELALLELIGIGFAAVFFGSRIKEKGEFIFLLTIPAIVVAYCVLQLKGVAAAVAFLFNAIAEQIASEKAIIILPFATKSESAIVALIPLAMLFAEMAYLIVTRAKPLAGILLLLTFAALGSRVMALNNGVLLMALACLVIMAQLLAGKKCTGRMKTRMFVVSTAFMAVILLVSSVTNLVGHLGTESIREAMEEDVHSYRYEGVIQPLPEGNFTKQSSEIPEEIMLEVTMEEAQPMYLRGYVGEEYTKEGWKALPYEELKDARNNAYILQKEGFDGQTQLSQVAELLGEDKNHPKTKVEIKTKGACREFYFVPYGIEKDSAIISGNDIGDAVSKTAGLKGQDNYSFQYIGNLEGNAYEYGKSLANKDEDEDFKDYMRYEAGYRDFVYDHYLEIPKEESELIAKKIGVEHKDLTTYEAKAIIRKLLAKDANFAIVASDKCRKDDFLKDFLNGEPGNSVQYASAAVLMMRECGIPARYVEGYAISPTDYNHASGEVTAEVPATSARAWAEYYEDGVGWIPFDTVPMYKEMLPESKWQNFSADSLRLIESAGTEAGASAASKQDEGGSQNPEEDLAEDDDQGDLPEDPEVVEVALSTVVLAAIILLILIEALVLMVRRARIKSKRKKLFESEDVSLAINAMFSYGVRMMTEAGFEKEKNEPFTYCSELATSWFGEDINFTEIAKLNEEALFSKHSLKEEQREQMKAFCEKATLQSRKKLGALRKIKLTWINCLY